MSKHSKPSQPDKRSKCNISLCCANLCLLTGCGNAVASFQNTTKTINNIQKQLETLTHKEKNRHILNEIAKGFVGVTSGGNINLQLKLEVGGNVVCSKAFQIAYNIGHSKFQYLCKVVKRSGVLCFFIN